MAVMFTHRQCRCLGHTGSLHVLHKLLHVLGLLDALDAMGMPCCCTVPAGLGRLEQSLQKIALQQCGNTCHLPAVRTFLSYMSQPGVFLPVHCMVEGTPWR